MKKKCLPRVTWTDRHNKATVYYTFVYTEEGITWEPLRLFTIFIQTIGQKLLHSCRISS